MKRRDISPRVVSRTSGGTENSAQTWTRAGDARVGTGAMPKKRRTARSQAMLARQIQVQSIAAHVDRRAHKPRGSPPTFEGGPWLQIRGTADEAVGNVNDVTISLHLDESDEPGPVQPPSVGAIIQIRPHIHAVVGLPAADFDRVWALAMSRQLGYCWLAFTEPYRGSAHIINISFSNVVEE